MRSQLGTGPGSAIRPAPVGVCKALRRSGKSGEPEARESIDRALRIRESLDGTKSPSYARALQELGLLQYANERYPEALATLKRALEIQQGSLAPNDLDLAQTLL